MIPIARQVWRACLRVVAALAILIPAAIASAQTTVSLTGRVTASSDQHPIAGAVVVAGAVRGVTNAEGRFVLALTPGVARLDVSAANFASARVDVAVVAGMAPLDIVLVDKPGFREEVTVTGTLAPAVDPSGVIVAPTAVQTVAGAADNIFRALQTLPGVHATDDFGSRLTVRGGGPDQNLTVMDGVEIHNPYRLFGLTSAFNPETVERFELTAGGFGAPYGDRLSSILLVNNRSGTTKERFAGSTALSLTDANVVFEGKLPGDMTGSWLVTGRRTYYDLVAERFTHSDLPSFQDVQVKGVWEPKSGHTLNLFGLRSRESTDATFTGSDPEDRIQLGNASRNDLAALTWSAALGPRVSSRTIVAWYRYDDSLDIDGAVRSGAGRSNAPGDDAFRFAAIVFTRDLTILDRSVRQELTIPAGDRHVFDAGFDAHALRTRWGWTIAGDRNEAAANGTSVLGGSSLPSLLRSTRETTRSAAWLQDRYQVNARVRVEPGLRLDHGGLAGDTTLSPRLSAHFDLTPRTSLRGAAGLFTQSPGYEKLLQANYFVDLTPDAAANLTSERSRHAVGTLEHRFTPFTGRVEAYYKTFDRLVVGRLETPEETAARVAQYNFPAALASSVPASPAITSVPVNGASGRAYGFDVYAERTPRSARDRLTGWASYTWSRSDLDSYGRRYPFDYDRRHAVSVVGTVGVRPRIDVSATLRVASGFPTTLAAGVRGASTLAPSSTEGAPASLVPATDAFGRLIWTVDMGGVGNLNSSRLPRYARLDVRVTFKPKTARGRWLVYFEVLNALNRENVGAFQPNLQFDPTSDRPSVAYSTDTGLPRLPSFGLRIRF